MADERRRVGRAAERCEEERARRELLASARTYLEAFIREIEPVAAGTACASGVATGYVDPDAPGCTYGNLTPLGWKKVEVLTGVALHSARTLGEAISRTPGGVPRTVGDAELVMAVAAAALTGMRHVEETEATSPSWVALGLRSVAECALAGLKREEA